MMIDKYNYQHNYKVELGKDFYKFHFKDQVGIYIKDNTERLFIECIRCDL